MLGSVADALSERADVDSVLREVLPLCLDAAGIPRAIVYVWDPASSACCSSTRSGFGAFDAASVETCFGSLPLLQQLVMVTGVPLRIPSAGFPEAEGRALLSRMGLLSAYAVPLGSGS